MQNGMITTQPHPQIRLCFVPTSKILMPPSKSGKTRRQRARQLVGCQACRLGGGGGCTQCVYSSFVVQDDIALFNGIISDLFPKVVLPVVDLGALMATLKEELTGPMKLQEVDEFLLKCMQVCRMFHTPCDRPAVDKSALLIQAPQRCSAELIPLVGG